MIGAVGYKVITLNRNQKELFQTMNTFTKKSLHVALAGLGTLAMAGAADAVMVNPNGLGQVLIYPYYTVRSPADVRHRELQHAVVDRQHDNLHEGGQGPLPRRQSLR